MLVLISACYTSEIYLRCCRVNLQQVSAKTHSHREMLPVPMISTATHMQCRLVNQCMVIYMCIYTILGCVASVDMLIRKVAVVCFMHAASSTAGSIYQQHVCRIHASNIHVACLIGWLASTY